LNLDGENRAKLCSPMGIQADGSSGALAIGWNG
jgi:hypothetical protein